MEVNKGLELDGTYLDNQLGSFKDAKNIILSKGGQGSENEPGFEYKDHVVGSIMGVCEAPDTTILFSVDGLFSEIGTFKDGAYSIKLRTQHLNFKTANPIRAAYTYNYLGELIVAWCDGIADTSNELKVLNLNNLPFDVDGNLELVSSLDIIHTYLFPDISNIKVGLNSVSDGGGVLKSGVYYIAPAYKTKDGLITEFGSISNPIVIIKDGLSNLYNKTEGCVSGINTTKSFSIRLSELNTRYNKLVLAVIYKENNSIFCKITNDIEFTMTFKDYIVSNYNTFKDYNIEEVITNNSIYLKAEDLSTNVNKLLIGNLIGVNNIHNLGQSIANGVNVKWTTVKTSYLTTTNNNTFKDPRHIFYNKHFKYGEVYALYLGLKYKKGGYLGVWHIPGRTALAGETDQIGTSKIENLNPGKIKRFQVEDTSALTGRLGYWENENETYPSTFPDFAGQRVRHHKMPELHSILDIVDPSAPVDTNDLISSSWGEVAALPNKMYIQFGIPVPNHINGVFSDYRFTDEPVYLSGANRKFTTNLAQVLSFHISGHVTLQTSPETENQDVKFTIEILHYNQAHVLQNLTSVLTHTTQSPTAFYSINTNAIYVSMALGDYIVMKVTGELPNANCSISPYLVFDFEDSNHTPVGEERDISLGLDLSNVVIPVELRNITDGWELFYAKRRFDNSTVLGQSPIIPHKWSPMLGDYSLVVDKDLRFHSFDLLLVKPNVTSASYISIQAELLKNPHTTSEIEDYTNIHQNVLASFALRSLANGEYNKTYIPVDNAVLENELREGHLRLNINSTINTSHGIFLADLKSYKSDVYYDFANQELISTGLIGNNTTYVGVTLGGDTFFNRYSYKVSDDLKSKVIYALTENANNADLRMTGDLDEHIYYPLATPTEMLAISREFDNFINTPTGIGYNYDFTSINDLLNPYINKSTDQFIDKFPSRVAVSLPQRSESLQISWRVFEPNNYKDLPLNRGPIIALNNYGRTLYIQMGFTLFVAAPKDVMTTLDAQAYLKEEGIFDREPTEIINSKHGYIGCSSKFATTVCMFGYVVVDSNKRSVFFLQEQPTAISDIKSKQWFFDNMIPLNSYNPFIGQGVFVAYDDYHKRFLLTYKGAVNSFSLSFSISNLTWYSFHDYVPDYWFLNNLNTYYIRNYGTGNNRLFLTNQYTRKGTYLYDGLIENSTLYPMSIDILINPEQEISKLIQNIFWQSVVKDSTRIIYNDTINKIMIYNETQCSGILDVNVNQMWYDTEHGAYINDTWYFNEVDDNVVNDQLPILDSDLNPIPTNVSKNLKNWFDISKFICKFIVVRVIYNNHDRRNIILRSIGATMIKDNR